MDYMTKPLSRIAIRHLSKYVRKIFELNESELFPVLEILEQTCIIFEGTEYSVLEDDKLPADVFAWCYPKPEGGFMIEIKQTVYDGALRMLSAKALRSLFPIIRSNLAIPLTERR